MQQLTRLILVFLGLSFFVVSTANAASIGSAVAAEAVVGDRVMATGIEPYPDNRVHFKGGAIGLPDVTYAYLSGYRQLKLDLYLPPQQFSKMGPRPLLIYIHGGGWVGGGPRRSAAFSNWPDVLGSIASRGYVVASVSYRFSGEEPSPAAIKDVKSAIRWLRVNANKYNIDKNRAMTWGQSAGGQLAGLAAVSCGVEELAPAPRTAPPNTVQAEIQPSAPEGFDQASDCVQGAVVWFGIYDFAKLNATPMADGTARVFSTYLGCGKGPCDEDHLRRAAAVSYVDASDPPILVMHGADDRVVPVAQSEEFYEVLKAAGVKTELVVIPEVGHSWIGKTPESTRTVTKAALQRTMDFIDATIGDKAVKK